jgi:hypothetical protein
LNDPVDAVRQAARRGLIILSYLTLNPDEVSVIDSAGRTRPPPPIEQPLAAPVDFGPLPGASPSAQRRAAGQWTEWWAENRPLTGRSTGQPRFPAEYDIDADSRHLGAPLLHAGADRKKELTTLFRDAEGSGYSEALAVAIAQASFDARDDLREALGARMTRVTDETLRRRLDDRLADLRRAGIVELVRRESKAHMNHMTALLLDPEPVVRQAAHTGLCQLSGQDFGPNADATQEERALAVAKWEKWWAGKSPR